MNVCNDGHEEVVYEGRHCPVCDLIRCHREEVEVILDKVDSLRADVATLEQDVINLTAESTELRSQIHDLETLINFTPL